MHSRPMTGTHPADAEQRNDALIFAVDACIDCAQACTACADACPRRGHGHGTATLRFISISIVLMSARQRRALQHGGQETTRVY